MPRAAVQSQRVTKVLGEDRLSIVRGRKAGQPDLWEADMRLGNPVRRVVRKLSAKDEQSAGPEAFKIFCKLDQLAAAGQPLSSPTFAKLKPLYRAVLDGKIAAVRASTRHRPEIAEAKIRGTHEKNWTTFEGRLLKFFGAKPIRGMTEADLETFVDTLRGRGGGEPKPSTVKALNGVFRAAMKCGIAKGWITKEAIPTLPVKGKARSAPRPAFSGAEWRSALTGMTDRWVATGLTPEDDARNAALPPIERSVPRLRRASVENRRLARAYAVILGASQARPGTEIDFIRPRDFTLNDPDPGAATPAVLLTLPFGKTGATRTVRIRGSDADAVRAAVADLRSANAAITQETPLFARPSDQRVLSPLDTLQTYLSKRGMLLDPSEGTRRSLYSIRHTSITQRVAHGVNSAVVAVEAGTSLKMMEEFYVARKHVIGGATRDPLTPPELRPLVVSPYGPSKARRVVASQSGQLLLVGDEKPEPSRVPPAADAGGPYPADGPWRLPADASRQVSRAEFVADTPASHPMGGGDPNARRASSLPDRGAGREAGAHARDTFVLDGWAAEPRPASPRSFAPSGDDFSVMTCSRRIEHVEGGGKAKEPIGIARGSDVHLRVSQATDD